MPTTPPLLSSSLYMWLRMLEGIIHGLGCCRFTRNLLNPIRIVLAINELPMSWSLCIIVTASTHSDGTYHEAPGFILMCQATTGGSRARHNPEPCGAGKSREIPSGTATEGEAEGKKQVVKSHDDRLTDRLTG